ncbi:MAG TPA: flagellar basal body P-ring formation chaperone FlgA [Stellaceae bacterium]|nr:flagellar basal body P-ring formation chaperone FlgA [Stellaceae bacterium]
MMMRRFIVLAALLLTALPGAAFADPMLQPNVTVTGDTIHIGDLFSDAGAHAIDPVAPSPAPGTRVTFNAAWLGAIAREHHLDWQPSSDFDQASVERATRTIAADTVAQRILAEAAPGAQSGDATIQLDNPGLRFIVPAEASDAMALDGLTVDPHSGRFSVYVTAPANAANAQRQRVTGRVIYQETIAVPSHGLAIGDIFAADDITEIKLPRDRVAADAITDPQELIGKAARRILRAGETIRVGDVEDPIVVHKGDLVTIELNTAAMQLTAQGKALDDGAMGAAIRINNTQSNRIIDAAVAGPNRVVIGNGGNTALLAAR